MPPDEIPVPHFMSQDGSSFAGHIRIRNINGEWATIPTTKDELCQILEMWPVYQRDDIGERVVAIYRDRGQAMWLQEMLDQHHMHTVPKPQATIPKKLDLKERLKKP